MAPNLGKDCTLPCCCYFCKVGTSPSLLPTLFLLAINLETLDQKYERLKKDCEASHLRTNKLLCERDPLRNERFMDRKAKVQYQIVMIGHTLNRLQEEAKPLIEKKRALEIDLQQIIRDHENFEDHQLYTKTPLSAMNYLPEQEIAELEKQLTYHAQISQGIRDRIVRVKAQMAAKSNRA